MSKFIESSIKAEIIKHASACYPKECCGFVIDNSVIYKAQNISLSLDTALTDPLDYIQAGKLGKITAFYHSHTEQGNSNFSDYDIGACKESNLPWILYNCSSGRFFYADPSGDQDYIGRDWIYGLQDCYSLIQCYLRREYEILISDYDRGTLLEYKKPEWNRFLENLLNENFRAEYNINSAQKGDVILMNIGSANPNHVGVLTKEGKILHHLLNSYSRLNDFSSYSRIIHCLARHESFY